MKRIVSILQLLILGGLFCSTARAQGNDASKKIIDKLSQFEANYPVEKAYLQFDKPYYAAGDTIYFKAYVTAGEVHKLSNLSGVLHVDFVNTKNKIDQSIKLQLDSGLAWGDFALPDSLPAGNYRIRAYTQWMRNFGETGFFEKTFAVVSSNPQKIPESGTTQGAAVLKPDVQFFPEGGSLVTGVASKVAFKVTGANGMGIAATGTVVDNDGREIAKIESAHLGMGYFYITPAEGKSYHAKISYPDGKQNVIDLPKAEAAGIVLSVNNDSIPQASVQIAASADYFRQNRGRVYTLIISTPGTATTVNCKLDSPVIRLAILKRKLHTGVATLTLFSPENEPLAERLLFIQNYDQLSLNVSSDKNSYAKREKVNIKLNVLNRKGDPSAGHFSVSVIDESKVRESGSNSDNILTNLLLTSDVKGYIEQPAYYFEDTSATARKNLDILMLTQGYRRFDWKRVLDSAVVPLKFQREHGLTIDGRVDNLLKKPVAKGTITLIPQKGGPILTAATDNQGLFHFTNLIFIDTGRFVLSAVKANGKNSTQITWLKNTAGTPHISSIPQSAIRQVSAAALSNYALSDKAEHFEVSSFVKGKMLKEVIVKDRKIEPAKIDPLYGPADQVIHGDQIEYGGSLAVRLMGKLHGIHFIFNGLQFIPVPNHPGGGRILIVVDGSEMPYDFDISSINTGAIESIELMDNSTVYTPDHGAVIIINTTHGLQPKDMISMGVLPITIFGFYKARTFYSPRYDHFETTAKQKDLRSTIYWNPEIKTGKDGNAGFDFYNADGVGTYKVTIEGIDKDGNLGRQVYRYTVQ